MSSILDALDKLDTATTPVGGTFRSGPVPTRRRSMGIAAAAGAFVAGAAVAGFVFTGAAPEGTPGDAVAAQSLPLAPPKTAPRVVPPARPAPAPAAGRVAAPLAGVAGDELPWAEPIGADEPEPAPAPLPRLAMARAVVPAPEAPAPPAPRPLEIEPEPPAIAPPPPPALSPHPPAGAPEVRLSFLMYSKHPERRTVAVTIDGAGLTTLQEGDAASGFEVVRIHRDHAEMTFQGEPFALFARD